MCDLEPLRTRHNQHCENSEDENSFLPGRLGDDPAVRLGGIRWLNAIQGSYWKCDPVTFTLAPALPMPRWA